MLPIISLIVKVLAQVSKIQGVIGPRYSEMEQVKFLKTAFYKFTLSIFEYLDPIVLTDWPTQH